MRIFHNPKLIFLFCYILAAIASAIALLQLSFFIYHNIYKTIFNSDQILILRSMVAMDQVDFARFNQIMENLDNKSGSCVGPR